MGADDRRPPAGMRFALGALVVAVLAGLLTWTLSGGGGVSTDSSLPSLAPHCGSQKSSAFLAVPFQARQTGSSVVPVVGVCIGSSGPYPFVVSTGAATTVVTPALASAVHVSEASGKTVTIQGVTCTATAPQAQVSSWSMGGMELLPQNVVVASVQNPGGGPAPAGEIGSDVLSRFGIVQIDYQRHRLVVGEPEGTAPASTVLEPGLSDIGLPAELLMTKVSATVPMSILRGATGTVATVSVKVDKAKEELTVDSGASRSSLLSSAVSALRLQATTHSGQLSGVGCSGTGSQASRTPWSLGKDDLGSISPVTQSGNATIGRQKLAGTLGADVLSNYGSMVINYAAGHLWLGST